MAVEIERKFLVVADAWAALDKPEPVFLLNGYLSTDPYRTVRVRVKGNKAFLTVKGISIGASRLEFEYSIPPDEAKVMIQTLASVQIEKQRYEISYEGFVWEVDVFHGENTGLIVAEIELASETQEFPLPHWIGQEVTTDERYFNNNLGLRPFSTWNV